MSFTFQGYSKNGVVALYKSKNTRCMDTPFPQTFHASFSCISHTTYHVPVLPFTRFLLVGKMKKNERKMKYIACAHKWKFLLQSNKTVSQREYFFHLSSQPIQLSLDWQAIRPILVQSWEVEFYVFLMLLQPFFTWWALLNAKADEEYCSSSHLWPFTSSKIPTPAYTL